MRFEFWNRCSFAFPHVSDAAFVHKCSSCWLQFTYSRSYLTKNTSTFDEQTRPRSVRRARLQGSIPRRSREQFRRQSTGLLQHRPPDQAPRGDGKGHRIEIEEMCSMWRWVFVSYIAFCQYFLRRCPAFIGDGNRASSESSPRLASDQSWRWNVADQVPSRVRNSAFFDNAFRRAEWKVRNFKSGLELFERIGAIAESEKHHPDLHLVSYNQVAAELHTHSIGGLTENDFIVAAKINDLEISDLLSKKKTQFWAWE